MSSRSLCWRHFREKSSADVPVPPGAADIPDYPERSQMPDKVTYYAVVDDLSSRERPAGVFRRTYFGGRAVCAMKRSPQILMWENSASLVSAERGDLQNDFIEITEDEANQLVERTPGPVDGHEQRLAPSEPPSPARVPSRLARDVALSRQREPPCNSRTRAEQGEMCPQTFRRRVSLPNPPAHPT